MPDVAAVLKGEICRLAKKEVKVQVGTTKQTMALSGALARGKR